MRLNRYYDDYTIPAWMRRARRKERARRKGTHTKLEWQSMRALFLSCPCCETFDYVAVKDHVISLADGGSDAIENIQPLCRRCNCSKGAISHDFRDCREPRWREKLPIILAILEEIDNADRIERWKKEFHEQQAQLNG